MKGEESNLVRPSLSGFCKRCRIRTYISRVGVCRPAVRRTAYKTAYSTLFLTTFGPDVLPIQDKYSPTSLNPVCHTHGFFKPHVEMMMLAVILSEGMITLTHTVATRKVGTFITNIILSNILVNRVFSEQENSLY